MTTQFSTIYTSFQEYSAYWELNNSPRQLQAVLWRLYKIIYFLNKIVTLLILFIKTSNRSSFLSIKLLFSGFQISFPIFLNNLLYKKISYCNCNRHLMFFFMSGVWHITVEWKIIDNFSKMIYQKNENVWWKARYIKVSILFI